MARARAAIALGAFIRQQRQLQDVSQIERGLRAPSDHVLEAIAVTLEMSADALRDGAGVPRPAGGGAPSPVVEAILADDRLTAVQRRALVKIYETFTS